MADLFTRFVRLLDRLRDGERVGAAELATVAPLFVSAPAADLQGLVAQLTRCAGPGGASPIGEVVLGPPGDAAVSWACAGEAIPAAVAHIAAAVVLVDHARELLAADEGADLARRIGLDPELLARVADTGLRARQPDPGTLDIAPSGAWSLVISAGVPVVEIVSPYVRDTGGSIDAFAARCGERVAGDDDRYRLLDALLAQDPRLGPERARGEASCGIRNAGGGVRVIDPAALDLGAVDPRARNALHALRRKGGQVVVAPPARETVARLLRAAEPPERIIIVSRADTDQAEIVIPRWVRHVDGHLLQAPQVESEALCAGLPRETQLASAPQLVSLPGWEQLREDVRAALRAEVGAVDGGVYDALLPVTLAASPWTTDPGAARQGPDPAVGPPASCLAAIPSATGVLAVAVWRLCGAASWRPIRGRAARGVGR